MTASTAHGSAHDAHPSRMARYPDLPTARRAIESLEAAGIDGNDIALVGEGALEAEHVDRRPERDTRVLGHVTKWVLLGGPRRSGRRDPSSSLIQVAGVQVVVSPA